MITNVSNVIIIAENAQFFPIIVKTAIKTKILFLINNWDDFNVKK